MATTVICRMRALQNYEPSAEGELGFYQGDTIYVIEQSERFWWYGQLEDGNEGYFPVDYSEFIGEGDGEAEQLSEEDAVALIRAAWNMCVQAPKQCKRIQWAVVLFQSYWRGILARRIYREMTRRLNMDKIPKATTSTLNSVTKARASPARGGASGPSRRPPTRRAKIAIETKTSTEEPSNSSSSSSSSASSSDAAAQPSIRRTFGGPSVLTFDPTAVQLRKKADVPVREKPAEPLAPLPFVGVQLRKTERPAPSENSLANTEPVATPPVFPTLRKTEGPRSAWASQEAASPTAMPVLRPPPVGPPRPSNPPAPTETFHSAAIKGASALSPQPLLQKVNLRSTISSPLELIDQIGSPSRPSRTAKPPALPALRALDDSETQQQSSNPLALSMGAPTLLPRRPAGATPGDITQRAMQPLLQSQPPPPPPPPIVSADPVSSPSLLPRPLVHPAAASLHQAGRTRESVHPLAAALKQELPEHPLRPACTPLPPPILPRAPSTQQVLGTGPLRPVHPAAQAMQEAGRSAPQPRPMHPAAAALSQGGLVRSPSAGDGMKRRPPPTAPTAAASTAGIRSTIDPAALRAVMLASRGGAGGGGVPEPPALSPRRTIAPPALPPLSAAQPAGLGPGRAVALPPAIGVSSSQPPPLSPRSPRTESDASARDIYAASAPPLAVRPGPSRNGYHWEMKRERVGGYLNSFLDTRPTSPEEMRQAAETPVYVTPPCEHQQVSQPAKASTSSPATLNTDVSPRKSKEKRRTVFPFQGPKACHACQKAFGLLASKVTCSNCSHVCCQKCTKNKVPIPGTASPRPQAVCEPCYRLILQTMTPV